MTTLSKVHHRHPYPAIEPSSPANAQTGRTVLITGSTSGIGLATARGFIIASAKQVIILGRRAEVLEAAISELEAFKHPSSTTRIISRQCDIADESSLEHLWKSLHTNRIEVDILILNAAKSGSSYISDGSKKVWEFFEMNVLANLRMTERFLKQGPEVGKVLINVSTAAVHINPIGDHTAYATSKASFAHMVQLLAEEVPVERCQILSVHPGRIFTEGAAAAGFTKDTIPWDSIDLPAAWSVWASTTQASFLHGRFLWTDWGVDELLAMKEKFQDLGFLKLGLQGVDPVSQAAAFSMT